MSLLGVYSMDHCISKIVTALGQRSASSVFQDETWSKWDEFQLRRGSSCTVHMGLFEGVWPQLWVCQQHILLLQCSLDTAVMNNIMILLRQQINCLLTRFCFSARGGSLTLPACPLLEGGTEAVGLTKREIHTHTKGKNRDGFVFLKKYPS